MRRSESLLKQATAPAERSIGQQDSLGPADEPPVFRRFLPIVSPMEGESVPTFRWDIPYTIPQLGYLVHSHYRYYGKFPSVVAGQILESYRPPGPDHYVLDNFCGSGTTLVEANLRGIKAVGQDISWLSVLASNVKVRHLDLARVVALQKHVEGEFSERRRSTDVPVHPLIEKWFSSEVSRDLHALQQGLLSVVPGAERDFLVLAFLGIVRRVSRAHDGEVRPHINKSKKQREVLGAFSKKVVDMARNHHAYQELSTGSTGLSCWVGDNRALPDRLEDGLCYLVISHPPYLNSFNYSPVYNLEFFWGAPFAPTKDGKKASLHRTELKAYPATEQVIERYLNHLEDCYRETFRIQPPGGRLAVVNGDCTRRKTLVPVVDLTIDVVVSLGYELEQVNYRTTHYGLGKYAYAHRADYHGAHTAKRDAIMIFRKP